MHNKNLRNMILAALFAALTAVMAQVSFVLPGIPSTVPFSMQVMAVMVVGGLLGPVWGTVSMILYVLMGAFGLPVFAFGRSGLGTLMGPTGGYLMAYPFAVALIGTLAKPWTRPGVWRSVGAMAAGLAVVYIGGAGWAVVIGGQGMGAVVSGWILPFVPMDLLKCGLAAALTTAVNRALVSLGYWERSAT